MRRRSVLWGIGALGAATWGARVCGAAQRPRAGLRVAVVGGGIVGSSIAMHLAQAGASVVLLERAAPATGATEKSFAWINPWTADPVYRQLRLSSMAAYRALDAALDLGITWGGYIDWAIDPDEAAAVRELAASMQGTAYATRRLDPEQWPRISPCIVPGPVAEAFYSPVDGHLDPVRVTHQFLGEAGRHGATVLYPREVLELVTRGDRVTSIVTGQGKIDVDYLVIAAGVGTPRLLAMLGQVLQLRHAPGILAHSVPRPLVTRIVYDGPGGLEFKQMADGSIVGTDAEEAPPIPAHDAIRREPMDFPGEDLRNAHGQRILAHIGRYMPEAARASLQRLTLGFRPMPVDGLPIVDRVPTVANAHVAVTHSGVTLAPILGRLVAEEIVTGQHCAELAPYRLVRPTNEPSTGSTSVI